MNSKILSVLKWIAFVTFLINLHAPISAEETLQDLSENTSSATGTYEQVEEDLGTQGFLPADPDPANGLDEEGPDKETEADTLENASSLESAVPMMATMATVSSPSVPTYQEALRDIATNLPNPEISMKLGSAVMDYPFRVPMGRNRLTPTVSLTYRASHSDGIAGVGWDLNIPSITRSLKRGVSYTSNAFTLNGEDLVLMTDDGDAYGTYRFEKEEDFDHIEFRPDNSWTITQRDGTVFTYGSDDDYRQSNPHGTFRWLLSSVTDSNGNRITYTYTPANPQDPDNKGPYFLATIEYADYYTLNFYYESRPDAILSYASKSKIVTTKRLKTVTVGTSDEPIRAWDINYRTSANTGRSLLERITEYGRDFTLNADNTVGSGTHLPPTEIDYDDSAIPISSSVHDIADSALNGIYSVPQRVLTGDWNGDGRTDLIRMYATNTNSDGEIGGRVSSNESTGSGFEPKGSQLLDSLAVHSEAGVEVNPAVSGDWNGDGKTDIGRVLSSGFRCLIATGNGWENYNGIPGFAPENDGHNDTYHPIFTGDWNGDGKTDIGRHRYGLDFSISTDGGWQSYGSGLSAGTSNSIFTGDFNGDGKTDILILGNDSITINISTGTGFGQMCTLNAVQPFGFNHTDDTGNTALYPLVTGDFNDDGLTDIGRFNKDHFKTFLSTGTNFVAGPEITNDLAYNSSFRSGTAFTGDFNDDGLTDIGRIGDNGGKIYTSTGTGFVMYTSSIPNPYTNGKTTVNSPLITGDFTGDGKTDLAWLPPSDISVFSPQGTANDMISQVTGTSGSITTLAYTPSLDQAKGNLPMILQLVTRITTDDGLGNTAATTFSYAAPLFDYSEREARSFGEVTRTNPDLTTETFRFHQDRFRDGKIQTSEHRASDGTKLSETIEIWESTPYDSESAFVRMTGKTETLHENNQTAVKQETFTYDTSHGSILTHTVSGTGLTESYTTAYTYDYYGSGLSYPLRTIRDTLSGSVSGLTRDNRYTYESPTGNHLSTTAVNTIGADPVTSYGYDSYGNLTSVTSPRGHATTYEYDSLIHTWLVRIERPNTGMPHVARYPDIDYRFGKPLSFIDENNFQTSYSYDVFGRTNRITHPDGGEELYLRNDTAMPRVLTHRLKDTASTYIDTITYTDGHGRTVQAVTKGEEEYVTTLFTFDEMGREACAKGPFFSGTNSGFLSADFSAIASNPAAVSSGVAATWTRNHYDDRGRTTRLEQSGGINTTYDHTLLSTRTTDPDGNARTDLKDILDRIIRVSEHGPVSDHTTSYSYNPAGDLLKVSRPNPATGNPIENIITYNTLGQKTAAEDRDLGYWTYTYDLNGNLAGRTDARGITLNYTYDALDRKTRKIYPNGSVATWSYDGAINGIGLPYRTANANAVTTVTAYDEKGRISSETRTVGSETVTFDYTRDLAGREASKAVTRNSSLFKTLYYEYYPATSLLARVKQSPSQVLTEITQYSPQGKIEFLNHSNGTVANYIYDASTARLLVIHSYKMAVGIMDKAYTYTKAGDVLTITDNRQDITYTYSYDHRHRLIAEQSSGAGASRGTTVEEIVFTYADNTNEPVHAPASVLINGVTTTYDYTLTGNRSAMNGGAGTASYASNPDNMISQVTLDGAATTFAYDADDKRVKKTRGSDTTLYFGERFEIVNGTSTLYLFAGNLRVAQIKGSELQFFHKDHLGSTSAISREDGTVVDFGEYLPYGLDRKANALLNHSAYKFTDQEQDVGTGLYNYDARLYDPVLGMFVMADTVVPDLYDPQSLNRYAYCLNNPLKYTDPTGHVGIAGGVIGGINGALSAGISAAMSQEASLGQIAGAVALGATIGAITGTLGQLGLSGTLGTAIGGFVGGSVGSYTAEGVTNAALGKGFKASKTNAALNGFIGAGAAVIGKVATLSNNAAALVEGHIGRVAGLVLGVTTGTNSNSAHAEGGGGDHFGTTGVSSSAQHPGICEQGIFGDPTSPTGERYGARTCGGQNNSTGNYNNADSNNNAHSSGANGSSSGNGKKIICVELYRQGLISDRIFQADERFGEYLSKTNQAAIIGYHFWATPVVKMMKCSKTVTRIVYFFAKPWTEEMAYRMNELDQRNLWGYILMEIGVRLCQLIGFILCNLNGFIWLSIAVTIVLNNPFQFRNLPQNAAIT